MHSTNIKKSYALIEKLSKFRKPRHIIAYLRQVDAYLVEEIVLTSLSKQGHLIERNSRYSGDGGIDGKASIFGNTYYIQTKRYGSHISNKHMEEFAALCKANKVRGLFVHTGRTGKAARRSAYNSSRVEIISGQRLVNLIQGRDIKIKGKLIYKLKTLLFGNRKERIHA